MFKLSVSNPKSKYVAYLSVLSQISNCQGLGRKNKHEILKTDCMPQAGDDGSMDDVNAISQGDTTKALLLYPLVGVVIIIGVVIIS